METIKVGDKISCIVYRDSDWKKGLNFITPNEMFIQAGSWWYDEGKELQKHVHKHSLEFYLLFDRSLCGRVFVFLYLRHTTMTQPG